MTVPRTKPAATQDLLSGLATDLVAQLETEEAALRETTAALEAMHQSLRGADLDALQSAQIRQEHLASQLEHLRHLRGDLCRSIALIMQKPTALTVRDIVARLPADLGQRLESVRQRIQPLAHQVDSLNRRNAVLAVNCLTFVQGCMADLYPEATASPRYSRAGQTAQAPRGSLLETQG